VDCRQIDRLLEANLEGRLSGFERISLRQHLKQCRSCRAKVEAMTHFAETVERTLACADGPDWRRLAPTPTVDPPSAAAPAPMAPAKLARPRRPEATERPRRKSWSSSLSVAVVGAALIAVAAPFWAPRTSPPPAGAWLEEAIAAEASRRAAGGHLDVVTSDPAQAAAWFAERGLPDLPRLTFPERVWLEGAFLDYLDHGQVAGLVLATPTGPVTVRLRPEPLPRGTGAHTASDARLAAVAAEAEGWRAALIGPPEAVSGSTLQRWLPAGFVVAGGG